MKIAAMLSGGLGAIIFQELNDSYQLQCVLTDSGSNEIKSLCQNHGIPVYVGNPRKGRGFDFLKEFEIDVLVSVNYLFLIDEDIIKYPKIMAFNIHGSLLPKYRGRTPHVWAIINNEKKTGITAHVIEPGCDTGAILQQMETTIDEEDTGATVLSRFSPMYKELTHKVLESIAKNTWSTRIQDESKATYFSKRTPEDGQINWAWQKERIRNWVRAQAHPYPGAFSFLEGEKIIVDKVRFSDLGFADTMPNGQIISVDPLCIKTPNGVLEIEKFRPFEGQLETGKILA